MIRSLNGKTPRVADSAWVSEAAYVVGDVVIGEGASVWPGATIRADSSRVTVGRDTAIQDNTVIHCDDPLSIGDGVLIGHAVVMHCKSIGDGAHIGNNATVLDEVEVGAGAVVEAGSVVTASTPVPPGTLAAGVPVRGQGPASEERRERVRTMVEEARALAQTYKAAGL
jgi:carbonic anhydrase/acetyltransferase-like protein (isoleucine patch superfamily)